MKTAKKLLVICFFCMTLTSLFLIPIAPAQEVVYNGANTEQFPYFSMYPSERYEFNYTFISGKTVAYANETYFRYDLIKGNESGFYIPLWNIAHEKGYSIWGNKYKINATSGLIEWQGMDFQLAFWNESIPFVGRFDFIPVDSGGQVSTFILDATAGYFNAPHPYQSWVIYPNIYSMHLWNGTGTDIYLNANYTDDGILLNYVAHKLDWYHFDIALMSQSAQLAPIFSFTTESGELTVSSSHISLDLTIPSADNNNDGLPDTDYEYRVLEGAVWSDWAVVTPFIDYNLGSAPAGNYTLTVEVKSMYGITQEQIEVEYTPSSEDAIPGFSAVLIMVILVFSVSILLGKYRKKY